MSENKFWYEKGSNKRHSCKNKVYYMRAFIHNEMIDYFQFGYFKYLFSNSSFYDSSSKIFFHSLFHNQ